MAVHREGLDTVDEEAFRSSVRAAGWAVLTGSNPTPAEFERFIRRFGRCTDTRKVHYPPDGSGLGFHSEDAYTPFRPDVLWFVCLSASGDDGAPTYLVDGEVVLADLGPEWQEFCRANAFRYDRRWAAYVWQQALGTTDPTELARHLSGLPGVEHHFLDDGALCVSVVAPIVTTLEDGRESFANTAPQATTQPAFYGMSLADGTPVPAELVTHVDEIAARHEFPLRWRQGDLAAIDNRRMMHRRGGYAGTARDLRAANGEDFFGTVLPQATADLPRWTKSLLQGEEGYPAAAGPSFITGAMIQQ